MLMRKPRFTKGPWHWEQPPREYGRRPKARLVNADGVEICNFGDAADYYPEAGKEPNEYDKNLIKTSPRLYEALEAMVAVFEPRAENQHERLVVDFAKVVLLEALGEQG